MRSFIAGLGLLAGFALHAQLNIEFVGQLSYEQLHNSQLANLWGYTDEEGNEYALMGVNGSGDDPGGISVVSLADPANPQEIFFYPGPASIWREVKVWNDHAYITTEANSGGLTVVDLSPLPQSNALTAQVWDAPDWNTSHALFIDENGRLYVYGSNRGNGGVIMYDLSDPWDPQEVGTFDTWYAHDGYARGDTMYTGHITSGFLSIVDVSDPSAPVLLGTQETPNSFTHNVWLDDSGSHLYTTDERPNSYVASYNVEDPSDIQFLDKLQSSPGSTAIPHNTYWLNDYVVTSYYTLGVTIFDASRPHNLVEVGSYDTSPLTGSGFQGAWGVYPFFGSQRLIVSDMEEGLFVLEPTYVRASWLEGTVRNASTSVPVAQATVTIVDAATADMTGFTGQYATGYHTGGTYTVMASAPGYESVLINGVVLVNGEVTWLDIDLQPLPSFTQQLVVVDALTGEPVPQAFTTMKSALYTYSAQADDNGVVDISPVFAETYEVIAGAWGFRTACPEPMYLTPGTGPVTIALEPGYADDFALDLGWTVTSTATDGIWERGTPVGTSYQGQQSNPGSDMPDDCGTMAYVTGNGGGAAGDDDVDGGNTVLTSPVFDVTGMWDPYVFYHRWFFNAGGSGAPNDRMRISLSNGATTVMVENITTSASEWVPADIRILDHLSPTATMQLIVFITDDTPGHLVEGGLDQFEVVEMSTVGLVERADAGLLRVWPNPGEGRFEVLLPEVIDGVLEIHDAVGRRAMEPLRVMQGRTVVEGGLTAGIYQFVVTTLDGRRWVQRVVVAR